ncbi:MAG TPA: NAD(P)-dependent alcohol dehydrogenase [Bacteroidales bacterium]|nr:NAD(P)-dependent alcohol dehydrogenase [Bacteroidales bacterium]
MKAVVYTKKHPGRLLFCDINKPVPGDDEVLIKIHATSLNAADYRSMSMGIIPEKKIFGADIAGEVESAGKNITMFKPGDRVAGDLASNGFGGLAEYVTAPEKLLTRIPENISYTEAATFPLAGITALQALRDKAGIKADQKVLIVGSAGSVGPYAVQLAKYFGAEVTGVCSSGNIRQTLSLGATYALDYTREDFTKDNKRYDAIIAVNGNYPLRAYKKCLNKGGTFVMVGGSLSQIFRSILFGRLLSSESKKMKFLSAKASKSDLDFLAGLMSGGIIKAVIARTYPLDKAAEAMNFIRGGHAEGKVVINVIPV